MTKPQSVLTYAQFVKRMTSGHGVATPDGGCPVGIALDVFRGRWKADVLYRLCAQGNARRRHGRGLRLRRPRHQLHPRNQACRADHRRHDEGLGESGMRTVGRDRRLGFAICGAVEAYSQSLGRKRRFSSAAPSMPSAISSPANHSVHRQSVVPP